MSKKTLNIETITNQLEGASAFFARSTPAAAPSAEATPPPISTNAKQAAQPHTASRPLLDRPDAKQPQSVPSQSEGHRKLSNVPPNERTSERSFQRKKIRHTFDIYHDQLLSLREMALKREIVFGERVLLGDLTQEALDMFITKERNNE